MAKKTKKTISKVESLPQVEEEISGPAIHRKKYPSPKRNPIFSEMWDNFIVDVADRENFKSGHLSQLSILCDLFVELRELEDILKKVGYTYTSESKNGIQIKPRPELTQKNKVLVEIRSYSKMLGLLLVKDTNFTDDGEKKDSWS